MGPLNVVRESVRKIWIQAPLGYLFKTGGWTTEAWVNLPLKLQFKWVFTKLQTSCIRDDSLPKFECFLEKGIT